MPVRSRNDEILDAALLLFADLGYHATTMNDIARQLGLKGPSLYNHVHSKQDLLVTVMSRTGERLLSNFVSVVESTPDTVEQLRRATESHVRYHARHRLDATVGGREIRSLDPVPREAVRELRHQYSEGFRSLLGKGCKEGVFTTTSPRLTAYAILGMGVGVSNWYLEEGEMSEDEIAAHYGDLALRMADVKRPRA